MSGSLLAWNVRRVNAAESPVAAAFGDLFYVDLSVGSVAILLPDATTATSPAIPVGAQIVVNNGSNSVDLTAFPGQFVNGAVVYIMNAAGGEITLTPDASAPWMAGPALSPGWYGPPQ